MITIEEFSKFDFRVGKVKEINKGSIKIILEDKEFNVNLMLDVKEGDKIVVLVNGDNLIIPLADGGVISPEKNIKEGSKVM